MPRMSQASATKCRGSTRDHSGPADCRHRCGGQTALKAALAVLHQEADALGASSCDLRRGRGPRAGRPGPRHPAPRHRPRHRHRHGQVRPCRPQDRRDHGLDRHAGPVRPSGGSQPWRHGHDHRGRCRAGPVQFRRDGGTGRPHHLFAPLAHPADRHHQPRATARWAMPPT